MLFTTIDPFGAAEFAAAISKRELAKMEFITTAKQIKDSHDTKQVKIGDAVCINNNSGVVIGIGPSGITMISAFWNERRCSWYEHHLNLAPDMRRTDSSYMNSVGHFVLTDANSYYDGRANTDAIAKLLHKKDKYARTFFPVFEHCIELGKECFLPSINQLVELFKEDIIKPVNSTLSYFHADEIKPQEYELRLWSSTDDVERLYKDHCCSESGAYALVVSVDGKIEKQVISKKEEICVLPFFNYSFSLG